MGKFFEKIKLLFGGYGKDGYNRKGYDREGYDRQGYNRRGFNRKRKHKITGGWYDTYGYNAEGFDRDGEHMDYAHLKDNRITFIEDDIIQVDLHGMSVKAAVRYLNEILDNAEDDIFRIVVIHGYYHGSMLKSVVRSYDHPRIVEIVADRRNEGATIFELE